MDSPSSTRLWRVYRQAGRAIPEFSDDPVTDYLVVEAVGLKVAKEDADARKHAEREAWKQQTDELRERVTQPAAA